MTSAPGGRAAPLKVLFVGLGESSHSQGWVDLFRDSGLDLRFFAMPTGAPPDHWPVPTYITRQPPAPGAPGCPRHNLYPAFPLGAQLRRLAARFGRLGQGNIAGRWLAGIIRQWRPDVIHTIGLRPASTFLHHVRASFGVEHIGAWVAQDWGPDLTMERLLPERLPGILGVLRGCDGYLTDNAFNYAVAREMGLPAHKAAPVGPVLASGGIDAAVFGPAASVPPSRRERVIVWPKAYNCAQALANPVLEALTLCWERIQPCRVHMFAAIQEEVRLWHQALPEHIRRHCPLEGRVERPRYLAELATARVMLAPSLSDGMPNVLPEAMAAGALPIVSPLDTITPHVTGENVLFARNLHPDEIAGALVRAMGDDALADAAAQANAALVRRDFDRAETRRRMLAYYADVARTRTAGTGKPGNAEGRA